MSRETVAEYQRQLDDLNEETNALEAKIDPAGEELEPAAILAKKTDIVGQLMSLVWVPYRPGAQGRIETAWHTNSNMRLRVSLDGFQVILFQAGDELRTRYITLVGLPLVTLL